MERASICAKALPSFVTVREKVARATEGAARSNPAKLFGLRRSPSTAKKKGPLRRRENTQEFPSSKRSFQRRAEKHHHCASPFWIRFRAAFGPFTPSTQNFLPDNL